MTIWIEIEGRLQRVELAEPGQRVEGGSLTTGIVGGKKIEVDARIVRPGALSVIVAGRQYSCVLDGGAVFISGQRFSFTVADPRSLASQRAAAAEGGGPRSVKAPMPGRVVRVLVEAGDPVQEHEGLIVIEAMKMQNELKSPKHGRVIKIVAEVGTTVPAGAVLVVVE